MIKLVNEMIFVFDFGSQYNQLIICCICEFGVYSELYFYILMVEEIKEMNLKGIILFGGLNSVYDENFFCCDEKIFEFDIFVLGICYGMQLMIYYFGGKVEVVSQCEYGKVNIYIEGIFDLFKDFLNE